MDVDNTQSIHQSIIVLYDNNTLHETTNVMPIWKCIAVIKSSITYKLHTEESLNTNIVKVSKNKRKTKLNYIKKLKYLHLSKMHHG